MGKSQKKVQRKKIDVTKETEILFTPAEDKSKKQSKKTSDLFYEDKTSTKSSTKRKWKNKMLHSDLIISSDKKRVIDTDKAKLDFTSAMRTLENKRTHIEGPQKKVVAAVGAYDLWGADSRPADIGGKVEDHTGGWLSEVKTGPIPKGIKRRNPSVLPPIEMPGDEESYVPRPEAYNELVEREERALERIDSKNKKLEKAFNKINIGKITSGQESYRQRVMDIVDEDVADEHISMPGSDEVSKKSSVTTTKDDDEIISDKSAEDFPIMAKLQKEAKQKKINKKSEYKNVPKNPKMFKKYVNSQFDNFDRIAAEAENKVAADAQKAILRKNRRRMMRNRPGYHLSKYGFVDESKLLLTPEQLPGSLRSMPNASSLLRDRYVNLQKRNIIPQTMKRTEPMPPSKKIRFVEKRIIREGLLDYGGDEVEFIKSL